MKKIVIISPVLPQKNDIAPIANSLSFLADDYHLDFIDPLNIIDDQSENEHYYQRWKTILASYLPTHDAFFGFSFGGVILQQCFSLFNGLNKSIVLFSTPTAADKTLEKQLGHVIQLCKQDELHQALVCLYEPVFSPNKGPQTFEIENKVLAKQRLISGLQRVLTTDSTMILKQSHIDHLHLIGESSRLVNLNNVISPTTGRLLIVPGAGMRVLQDNVVFCKKAIFENLHHEK